MKTPIIYKYGPTNLAKTEPALMEWSEDGKLRIWTEDLNAGTTKVIAELSPQVITKVSGQMTSVTIHTAQTKHRVIIVSDSSSNPNVGLPADQVINQYQEYKKTDVPAWIDSFAQKGIKVTHLNQAQAMKYAFLGAGAIIVCAIIYALLAT